MTLSLLLDTNTFIPLVPVRQSDIEANSAAAADLARMTHQIGGHLFLHPASVRELQRDRDLERRAIRDLQIQSFEQLASPPPVSIVEGDLGSVAPGSNDWVDNHLLAAVTGNAVHYLITEDEGIHRKARRLGLDERVLRIVPAVTYLRTLLNEPADPPPDVRVRYIHQLNWSDPIFSSLRVDYPGFDQWLEKAAREQRRGWTVESSRDLAGICLWKDGDDEYGLGGKVMKVSTFKVSDQHRGNRYGDLLLKALFQHLHSNSYDHVWLTIFSRHEELIALLEEFGFEPLPNRLTRLGELVLVKSLGTSHRSTSNAFEFHRKYGPPALAFSRAPVFIIPIQPRYHRLLFPDYEQQARTAQQAQLPLPQQPFGNALRKAYLSRSSIRELPRGATILFYRSDDVRGITAIGVVESTLRSQEPAEIVQFTNLRTVYSFQQITELASQEVISIRFRQDRLLPEAIGSQEMARAGVLTAPPQSITQVTNEEAIKWLNRRIDESR